VAWCHRIARRSVSIGGEDGFGASIFSTGVVSISSEEGKSPLLRFDVTAVGETFGD